MKSEEDAIQQKNSSKLVTGSALSTVFKHMDNMEQQQDPSDSKKVCDEKQEDETDSMLSIQTQRWLVIRRISYIVIVNAVMPILLYYALKPYLPLVWALVLSSTPTIISVLIQATFLRHIDTIGIASICGFLVSIILAVANGDPKLMLMRESLITAGVGATCALSLLPIRIRSFELKPILYYLAKDLVPLQPVCLSPDKTPQPRILFYWRNSQYCRLHIRLLTGIDIVLLELEFGLKLFYIFSFDIDTVVIASSITWATIGALISVFTICYSVRILRKLKQDEPSMLQRDASAQ